MRELIADDNQLMLAGVRRALQPADDIEIVATTLTGSQVLPLVERRRPDLVALELEMRGADGRRCLELVREQHPGYRKLGVPNRLSAANIAHARGIAVA